MSDWGRGYYERTALELMPAAERIIEVVAPGRHDRLLDVACGIGNAALLAAERGAQVSGVDLSPRLIEVARAHAAHCGLDVDFAAADACALPFGDDTFDVAVSVFGVVFASPAQAAIAELLRVVRAGGRIVLSTWKPVGALFELGEALRQEVTQVTGPSAPPPAWGDPDVVRALFAAAHDVRISEERLPFTAPSAGAAVAALFDDHPVWLAGAEVLGADATAHLRERSERILSEHNEHPSAWRATSTWLLVDVTM